MSLVDLKKIKKPEVEVEDINNMTKEELLNYIIDSFRKYYSDADIRNRAKYSSARNFYEGVARGLWESERIVKELVGRLNNDSVDY